MKLILTSLATALFLLASPLAHGRLEGYETDTEAEEESLEEGDFDSLDENTFTELKEVGEGEVCQPSIRVVCKRGLKCVTEPIDPKKPKVGQKGICKKI